MAVAVDAGTTRAVRPYGEIADRDRQSVDEASMLHGLVLPPLAGRAGEVAGLRCVISAAGRE